MEIPGYRIKNELGSSGPATVYLARQDLAGRQVAIKVITPEGAVDSAWRERFLDEARAVARLSHPHILPIYDVGSVAGQLYIAMKYAPDGNLKQRLRQGGLPLKKALGILRQLAGALDYAHSRGLLHRNLKPENILFDQGGQPLISDFAIAPGMGSGLGVDISRPHYLSPEQLLGKGELDGRCDLYSLGAVFFEMLTGKAPYGGADDFAVAYAHINDPLPRLPGALSRYQELLERLLAKNPADRYADGAELIQTLDRLQTEATPVPKTQGRKTPPRAGKKGGGGSKWLILGGLLLLNAALALLLGGGYWYWQQSRIPSSPPPRSSRIIPLKKESVPASMPRPSTPPAALPEAVPSPAAPSQALVSKTEAAPVPRPPEPSPISAPAAVPPAVSSHPAQGMEMVWVAAGCFRMGDTFGIGEKDEKPVHEVCVDGFWIGKYEVTQGEWRRVMGNNPSHFQKGDDYPVERVSWEDVQNFLRQLSSQSGKNYRLPTEAEWEYAASGGRGEKYAGTGSETVLGEYAWSEGNSGGGTHPVGAKKPNGLGLHDMSGNVWEWCADWYGGNYYANSARHNPPGPSSGSGRVIRGGCWISDLRSLRAAARNKNAPDSRFGNLGFRLALSADQPSERKAVAPPGSEADKVLLPESRLGSAPQQQPLVPFRTPAEAANRGEVKADEKAPRSVRETETSPNEDVAMVRRLMAAEANAADKPSIVPLFLASRDGHLDVVKHLLKAGINVNTSLEDGSPPLYWAAYGGRPEIVKLLLEAKADPNIRVKNQGPVQTPLSVAKSKGHDEVVRLLKAHGARE